MKSTALVFLLCLVAAFVGGCATSSFAIRDSNFIPDNYRPIAVLRNESSLLCEAAGPLPSSNHVYFYFNAPTNEAFINAFPASAEPAAVSEFLASHNVGVFYGQRATVKPAGFVEVVRLDENTMAIEAGGRDVPVGHKNLNAIWTVPVDVATSPIQFLFLLIMLPQIEC